VVIRCATSNPKKLAEFELAAPPEWRIVPAAETECEETGSTFEENAVQKALCYAAREGSPVFADDSGLEVDELGGAPGVHSARYAGPGATDEQNRFLLLDKLGLSPDSSGPWPSARFVCAIALAEPGRVLATFEGVAEGEIVNQPRGDQGFGYDPLFLYPPLGRTFAELSPREKLVYSHRGKAFRAMLDWVKLHRRELR